MRDKLLRRVGIAAAVGVIALAALAWSAREWHVRRLAPFTPLAEAFLDRALAGDSLGLLALATDSVPVERIVAMYRNAPDELALIRRTLRLAGGVLEADRALVVYETEASFCPAYLGHRGELQFQFTRAAAAWLVEYAAPPVC